MLGGCPQNPRRIIRTAEKRLGAGTGAGLSAAQLRDHLLRCYTNSL